ncbi:17 kDa surface antigen [Azospirillaceae bacterium]
MLRYSLSPVQALIPVLVITVSLLSGCASSSSQDSASENSSAASSDNGKPYTDDSGRVVAARLGSLVGAYIGAPATLIDSADQSAFQQAALRAYATPINENITWSNPQTGNHGSVVSIREGWSQSGMWCREFQHTVSSGERKNSGFGTACRQRDGSWQIME